MISMDSALVFVVVIAVVIFIGSYAKILREYERGVIFRLGRTARAILNPGGGGNGPGLVGRTAVARGPLTPEGAVAVAGELWRALADRPLPDGARVTVVDVQGLTLRVVAEDAPGGGTR